MNVVSKIKYSIAEHRLLVYGLQKGDHVIKRCVLVWTPIIRIIKTQRANSLLTNTKEDAIMALSNLFGWNKMESPASACGAAESPAACGAADKPEEKPAACGSACGAGDK